MIKFRAKAQTVYNMDDTVAYVFVQVPQLERRHCDMPAFRRHTRYGPYANSDLFPGILRKIRKQTFGDAGKLRLDRVPEGVNVDTSGFLVLVTLEV